MNADNTVNVQIYWRSREEGGRKTIPPIGLFYPVSEFEDGVFQENFPRSIVLDIYEHLPNKNMSYARARFLIRKMTKYRRVRNLKFLMERDVLRMLCQLFKQTWVGS